MAKKRTGSARYSDLTTLWGQLNERPFTIEEVVAWAKELGLLPVPNVRDSEEAGAAWDTKFAEVKSRLLNGQA